MFSNWNIPCVVVSVENNNDCRVNAAVRLNITVVTDDSITAVTTTTLWPFLLKLKPNETERTQFQRLALPAGLSMDYRLLAPLH